MPLTYRRPGVYLEESLLVNPSDVSGATTVACFVGAASQGPINEPTLIESWSDYVTLFGNFGSFAQPPDPGQPGVVLPKVLSYLPFAVYSFFQSGGRAAYIIRAAPTEETKNGEPAEILINGTVVPTEPPTTPPGDLTSIELRARSVGTWGNNLAYNLGRQNPVGAAGSSDAEAVFTLQVLLRNSEGNYEVVETFPNLSMRGEIPGTRKVDAVINDTFAGSVYVRVTRTNEILNPTPNSGAAVALATGEDPWVPDSADMQSAAQLVAKVEGPVALNVVGYMADASKVDTSEAATSWVGSTVASSAFLDREDIFIINDNAPPRVPNQSSSSYKSMIQNSSALGANLGDSYSASYGPWIIVPNPQRVGTTMAIPPGGGVIGVFARVDATIGVFRAPAGVIAGISNAVGLQTKFTDTELGDLNSSNINVIRAVVGAGIAIMGGRTRKTYGADRYVSPRRTLIYIKEVIRRSTQFAVFENNDQRLWAALRMSADRILRPLWEAGGLRGASPGDAYYIRCDETINTPSIIASGEVRMEVGVALEYPAEFIIIRITQFDRASFTSEVVPTA